MTTELAELIDRLPKGGKRKIAVKLGVNPGRITDARDGIVKNGTLLDQIAVECKRILGMIP